jgi:hypothetical protein
MGENKVSGFVLANPERMKKQEHKQAIVIAAAIFAARSLADWNRKRSPRAVEAAAHLGPANPPQSPQ